mmetsp:Transcript_25429/g.29037  ORF Transcript_25429/g.29037 Transcript_25429/m.29037 type:complete len:428 (+) Transcript_25429:145-1428(+)
MAMVSSDQATPLVHAISGALGSASALLLLYPLERVRTEIQASAAIPSSSSSTPPIEIPTYQEKIILEQADQQQQQQCHITLDESSLLDDKEIPNINVSPPNSASSSNESSSWVTCNTDKVTTPIPFLSARSKKTDKMENSSSNNETNESLIECLLRLQSKGELYRGVGPVVSTLATSNFVFFYAHQFMKAIFSTKRKRITANRQISISLLASSLAGIFNVLLTNPLWVANLRIVQGKAISGDYNDKPVTLWKELRSIAEIEGIGSLWKGTLTSLLLVSNPVIQFFFYGQLKQFILLRNNRRLRPKGGKSLITLSPLEAFVIGAIAKAISTILTYPLQLTQVLLRLQSNTDEEQLDHHPYLNTLDCLIRLSQEQGILGLFTGMKAKLLQTTLTAAFTFLSYEQILRVVHCTFLIIATKSKTATVSSRA